MNCIVMAPSNAVMCTLDGLYHAAPAHMYRPFGGMGGVRNEIRTDIHSTHSTYHMLVPGTWYITYWDTNQYFVMHVSPHRVPTVY